MYQHQHAPLPLERLKDVPQPAVLLLEKILKKDAAQRFRTPNEVLKAMRTITAPSMPLTSLHGLVLGSPRLLTIGSEGWLLTIIVLRSLFLAGASTGRTAAGTLHRLWEKGER